MKKIKSKLGVSIMIGYILLISIGLVIGGITYAWLKTYVPSDNTQCVEGVSMYLKKVECVKNGDGTVSLNITLENNGRFGITSYSGYIATEEDRKPTIELSQYLSFGGESQSNIKEIYFVRSGTNSFKPGDKEVTHGFEISKEDVKRIEIIPGRIEEIKGKDRFAVCTDSKVGEEIVCI